MGVIVEKSSHIQRPLGTGSNQSTLKVHVSNYKLFFLASKGICAHLSDFVAVRVVSLRTYYIHLAWGDWGMKAEQLRREVLEMGRVPILNCESHWIPRPFQHLRENIIISF